MVLLLLGPADQDRPVAVEPRVTGLDDPAACSPVGAADLQVELFSSATDVWCEAAPFEQVANHGKVVGPVQAETLGAFLGCLGALDRDRLEGRLEELYVVAIGAQVRNPDRDSRSVREERALRPPLALSVGLGPVFSPPSGAFVIAPSAASQDQSMPTSSS